MSAYDPWTTPHMRAERALYEAAVHMQFNRIAKAREKLHEALVHFRELTEAINREEADAAEIEHRRQEWMQRTGEPGA
jgi:hypothetical protein